MNEPLKLPNGGVAIMTFGFTFPPYTHGNVKCRGCETVVAQCGCPEGCKTVATLDKCVNCACEAGTPGDARLQPFA